MSTETQGPDAATMEAGPVLDERVCKALGIPGWVEYYAQAPGHAGTGWYFGDRRSEVVDVIERYTRDYPTGWQAGSTVEEVTRYPRVSTDISAAWKVVEKMRDSSAPRSRSLSMVAYSYNRTYATFDARAIAAYDPETWAEANGKYATPLAICRAALMVTPTGPRAPGE